jgi:hypothetical protein
MPGEYRETKRFDEQRSPLYPAAPQRLLANQENGKTIIGCRRFFRSTNEPAHPPIIARKANEHIVWGPPALRIKIPVEVFQCHAHVDPKLTCQATEDDRIVVI